LNRVFFVSSPYGIPRKTLIPFSTVPLTIPVAVVAIGASAPKANRSPRSIIEAAAKPEYCNTVRRSNSLILNLNPSRKLSDHSIGIRSYRNPSRYTSTKP
jgi:hypothetical protein